MMLSLALSFTIFVLCVLPNVAGIYNGKLADEGDPTLAFFVHFRKPDKPNFVCGGTLVSPKLVLTAAHCKIQAGVHTAYLGSRVRHSKSQAKLVAKVVHVRPYGRNIYSMNFLHDKYKDIAVVTLEVTTEEIFAAGLRPISIDWSGQEERRSTSLLTVGFGGTKDQKTRQIARSLRLLSVSRISTTLCLKRYFPMDHPRFALCVLANNRGTICAGDSGGPLLTDVGRDGQSKFLLVGVVIATTSSGLGWTCEPGSVVLAMRLKHFQSWWKRKVQVGAAS